MSTRKEVKEAFQFLLHRNIEDESVFRYFKGHTNGQLLLEIINSNEFISLQVGHSEPVHDLLESTKYNCICDLSDAEVFELYSRVASEWNNFGCTNPYWSVVTHDDFLKENIDKNKEAFFKSGEKCVELFTKALNRSGKSIEDFQKGTVSELGCGVGRVTCALAKTFAHVFAYDISKPHLELAKQNVQSDNVTFLQITDPESYKKIEKSDFFFSVITLQHSTPPIIYEAIKNYTASLKKNGIGYFQVPTHKVGYHFLFKDYITTPEHMEMHIIPQHLVFRAIHEAGAIVRECIQESTTINWMDTISNIFVVEKVSF